MPVHEAVESALLKSALGGNVTAQIFCRKNYRRFLDKWGDRADLLVSSRASR